ncbi:MAG TPA: glycoside hydrolase family 140 protein [Phycisphaerae bacterium]|nr:glycoside hydrolase family 140 protein [Phycisphaerae bacterium]
MNAAANDKPGVGRSGSVKAMQLSVSPNRRHFVDQHGQPFFYLADTAWTLFKRLDRWEVDEYLANRAAKGFTVIQAYVLRGLRVRNINGDLTLIDRDPTRPNEAFFRNVDHIVDTANQLGLVMGLVVSYGEHVKQVATDEQIFDTSNAFTFGEFLAARYRDNAVIWLLGGDRQPTEGKEVWAAMARGLKAGSNARHLVSYHGPGPQPGPTGYSSSFWFHDQDWLDFNTIQSSHRWAVPNYQFVTHDYNLAPVKPTLDMEARYENHPDGPNTSRRMDAHQEREAAYWGVLAGAAGHGYGCNDIWQFYNEQRMPDPDDNSFPFARLRGTTHWREAMDFAGAFGMGLMRRLIELRPWYRAVPDESVIADGQGDGEDHIQAARADDGSFLLAYLPFGHPVAIDMGKLAADRVKAHWYGPREGTWLPIGQFAGAGVQPFTPPSSGEKDDWVLVLDDAAENYPTPAP